MIVPQVLSYLRSVVGVTMGVVLINGNAIEISGTEPLEYDSSNIHLARAQVLFKPYVTRELVAVVVTSR